MTTTGLGTLDADLRRSVRRTSYMRQLFYVVVLLVALAGQVSGAVEALGIPLLWAIPAVGALELGGIVVLANADVRRRLGEKATASRILSVAIAAFAVAFNWLAHDNKLLAGFFAGMSALGYLVWLMHTENQRRDRLRATGDLPAVTPAYEVIGHWMRHPWLTLRAKNLAKADPRLGLYSSIAAAKAEKRKEQRTGAIAKVLHRKIRAAVDPTTADIAVAVYDLDEIAVRLADGADYDGLTALIAADLHPARIAGETDTAADSTPDIIVVAEPVADIAVTDADTDPAASDTAAQTTPRPRLSMQQAVLTAQSLYRANPDIALDIIAGIVDRDVRTVRRYLNAVGRPTSAPPAMDTPRPPHALDDDQALAALELGTVADPVHRAELAARLLGAEQAADTQPALTAA